MLREHDTMLMTHDPMLTRCDTMLTKRDTMLRKHDTMFMKHDPMLMRCDTMLTKCDTMLTNRDTMLMMCDTMLTKHELLTLLHLISLSSWIPYGRWGLCSHVWPAAVLRLLAQTRAWTVPNMKPLQNPYTPAVSTGLSNFMWIVTHFKKGILRKTFLLYLFIFLKFLENMSSFCEATDTSVLNLWWRLLWVSKPEWGLIRTWRGIHVACFLRFTSGATPADLLTASMAAEPISSTYLQRHWWDSIGRPLAPWANAQLTELCWLGLLNSSEILHYVTSILDVAVKCPFIWQLRQKLQGQKNCYSEHQTHKNVLQLQSTYILTDFFTPKRNLPDASSPASLTQQTTCFRMCTWIPSCNRRQWP